jgi:hypothetical protein
VPNEFELLTENEELRKSISQLQKKLRQEKTRNVAMTTAAKEGAREAFTALGRPPEVRMPSPKSGQGKPEVAVLHLSDWQTGKKTSSFDSEIAERRIEELGKLLVRMTEIERSAHPVDECWLLYGGDHVEGVNIFPGQQWEIDSTLFEQHARASRMLTNITRLAAATFRTVHVVTEDGNHGRIGRRGDVPVGDNSDRFTYYSVYLQLEDLRNEGRVVWHDTTHDWHSIFEIGNYRGLLVHGDEVKSFGGQTPAFGIGRKVAAWAAGVIDPFHDCYMGHWHQPLVLPLPVGNRRVFVNGSIESDSIYAQEFVGANGFPSQRLNFVEPEKGRVTSERVLWLK